MLAQRQDECQPKSMTFEEEMKRFWVKYTKELQQEIQANLAYQEAENAGDSEKAQRIACQLIEGDGRNKREAKYDRDEKRFNRTFGPFDE